MNQNNLAYYRNLRVGDRIVREKGIFSKHHGIYVGIHNGVPLVAENQIYKGVQYVSLYEFLKGNELNITRIEKFSGTNRHRQTIITRIHALKGTNYDLVNFNCEHFVEQIYTGVPRSKQVENVVGGIALFAFIALLVGVSRS